MPSPEISNYNSENLSPVKRLVLQSIEGQVPSWKNALSRKFVSFGENMTREAALEEFEKDQNRGFLYTDSSRRVVDLGLFTAGYYLAEEIQEMDSSKYFELIGSFTNAMHKLGLQVDENFIRWQMSDFFGAGYYAFCLTSFTRLAFMYLGEKEALNKNKVWWESKSGVATPIITGVILTSYEVLQAAASKDIIDVKDLAAYFAGIGLFFTSEKIWKEYQIFKKQYRSKNQLIVLE